jgi:hypothetical protein
LQDLKDFLRPAGKSVCYADVIKKEGKGTAAFEYEGSYYVNTCEFK